MNMRRKDREITDPNKIDVIIRECDCIRIGFNDNGEVYIVPLNFGFIHENGVRIFYFHGAKEGRKIDLIRTSPYVGFELDCGHRPITGEIACQYALSFRSVTGNGNMEIVEDTDEKRTGLDAIMRQFTGRDGWSYSEAALKEVCVMKLTVTNISAKEHE